MWKSWQFRRVLHLRRPSSDMRREAKITECSVKGEIYYIREKEGGNFLSNSVVAGISEDTGFGLKQEGANMCENNVRSVVKVCSGIGKLVIAKCSYIFESKGDNFEGKCSLQDVLKLGFQLSPETLRRFWRASELKPENFLDILTGFRPEVVEVRKARFLWNLFRWASWQSKEFQHLPRSNEIMVSMLVDAQMLNEAESLLLSPDGNVELTNANVLFSQIIQAYSEIGNLGKSLALYSCARYKCLIPSALCYQILLRHLIRKREDESVLRVYLDMLEVGLGPYTEEDVLHFAILKLIKTDRFVQAIGIIRQLKILGIEMSQKSLSSIAKEFCKRQDIEDMMNFLEEWRYLPELCLCNQMLTSLCTNLGTDDAWLLFQRWEAMGFIPDSTTFEILICHSCRERNLKAAFIYLSECFSRQIEPKVCAYNALISGIFREGLYRHAKYVFEDMVDRKVKPDLLTYKILLAGYCKYKKFDDLEQVLSDMKTNCMINLPAGNCVLSKSLSFLGLDHLGVKVKRDNAAGFSKAEFFDSIGNGLYLDTDFKKFEISLVEILDNAIFPDISSELISACQQGNIASAFQMKDEAIQWGHSLSTASYLELLKTLCANPTHIMDAIVLIEEMPDICDQLDAQTVNLLAQTLSRNRMSAHARLVLNRLFRGGLAVHQDTYTVLMTGFCRERNIVGFWECWNLATKFRWSPGRKEVNSLISCLCKWGVIKETLELINTLPDCYPDLFSSAYNMLLEELCRTGYTSVGCAMLEALLEKGVVVDCSLYFHVTEGFLKEQKTAEAIGMYGMWIHKSKAIDASTCRFVLSLLPRFDVEQAMGLVETMLTMEFTDASAHSCIVKELIQAGKIKQAASILQELTVGKKFSGALLNTLLQAYCHLNNWRKVKTVLCMMLRMHAHLSISSYRCLVREMCDQNRFASASGLKDLVRESDKQRELILCNILIFYLFQRRNILQVHDLLKDMQAKDISLDKTTYDFLVYGFHKSGDTDHSVNMLEACIVHGLTPSNRSLRIVLSHFCRLGNLEKSLELFHLIERRGWKHGLVIGNTITLYLLSFGRHTEAKYCLDNLSKSVIIGSNVNCDVLIKELCILGDMTMAVNLLNTMLKKGGILSEVSYSFIMHRLCILKEFDHALDFLAEMQFLNLKPSEWSCDALIRGLCATGRICDAKRILEILTNFGSVPSYDMYKIVFDKYCRSNNAQEAAALLYDMQRAGYMPNFDMHWSVISNLSNTDKKTEGDGEPILSNLLSFSALPVKKNKVKAFSVQRYNYR